MRAALSAEPREFHRFPGQLPVHARSYGTTARPTTCISRLWAALLAGFKFEPRVPSGAPDPAHRPHEPKTGRQRGGKG